MNDIGTAYLEKTIKRFAVYKQMGDKTFEQLSMDAAFLYQPHQESNSIAIIVQHMSGNMLSRWTDLLTTDGEKEWRQRDLEFEPRLFTKQEVLTSWESGWNCLFAALQSLTGLDLLKIVKIRGEDLSVLDAIQRQLAHYASHVGQIVYLGKLIKRDQWQSQSIPKGQSDAYNQHLKKP